MSTRNNWLGIMPACGVLGLASSALAGSSVCDTTSSGREICVRFDNVGTAPIENTDFEFDLTTDPDAPTVHLLRGDNGTTTYEWRVWCKDGSSDPANIGAITGLLAEDYQVRILDDSGSPGAATSAPST